MAMTPLESVRHSDNVAEAGCYLCRRDTTAKRGPLVDFDKVIVGEGRLVICANCVHQAGAIIGLIDTQEAQSLKDEATRLFKLASDLAKENERLNEIVVSQAKFIQEHNVQPTQETGSGSSKAKRAARKPAKVAASSK